MFLIRDLYLEYIKNSYHCKKTNNPIEKWVEVMNKHFSKEDII